jgi:hypothetical protein
MRTMFYLTEVSAEATRCKKMTNGTEHEARAALSSSLKRSGSGNSGRKGPELSVAGHLSSLTKALSSQNVKNSLKVTLVTLRQTRRNQNVFR